MLAYGYVWSQLYGKDFLYMSGKSYLFHLSVTKSEEEIQCSLIYPPCKHVG